MGAPGLLLLLARISKAGWGTWRSLSGVDRELKG
jgi:hypothetical protein